MRLKSVELFGFKSFPDRTVIEFGEGITAILGPNGCGKSNVVDAIKWVLGEKSAKNLRGEEMLDVIFSGCETRSASGMAEVKLNFDNTDQSIPLPYNEISVGRRLYRSRESEYFINQNRCRLKDVRDLFLDTGIGSSAYSVIEQGRVEALLHAKPADRRAVFEEAAGISKFKIRRKEILSRLERTDQVFLRVNDRVEEKERQIKRVSTQAANARRYRRLKAELDDLKTYLYRRQFAELSANLEAINLKRQALENEIANEDAALTAATTEVTKFSAEETELTTHRDAVIEAGTATQEELSRIQLDLTNMQNRMNSLKGDIARRSQQRDELAQRVERLTNDEAEFRANLETSRTAQTDLEERFSRQDGERRSLAEMAEAAEREVNDLRGRVIDLNNEKNSLTVKSARLEADSQSTATRLSEIDSRLERISSEEGTLRQALQALENEYESSAAGFGKIADEVEQTRQRLNNLMVENDALLREERSLDSERSAKASRKATLEDLENSFAGAYEGVKNVLNAARQGDSSLQGVVGMAIDLMSVPQDLALAVETILGASAQDIVVDSARDAQSAIEYLKRNRLGRATFLPLDRIQPRRRLNQSFRNYPGVLGEAVDLVSYEPGYRVVMEHLLAGILVVDNLNLARELAGREARGVKIVTLEGDVVSPSGSMTGGHGRQQRAGLVQRKAELDSISMELADCEQRLAEKTARRQEIASSLSGLKERIAADERSLAEAGRNEASLKQNLAVRQNELARFQKDREEVIAQRNGIMESSGDWQGELAQLKTRLEAVSSEMATLETETVTKTDAQRSARAALEALGEDFAALSGERATIAAKINEYERRLAQIEREKSECQSVLSGGSSNTEAEAEIEVLFEQIAGLREKEEELLRKRDEQKVVGVELAERLIALRENTDALRRRERECQTQIARIREGISQLERQTAEYNVRLDTVREKAREELQLEDLSMPEPVAAPEEAEAAEVEEQPILLFSLDEEDEPVQSAATEPAQPVDDSPWAELSDSQLQKEAESLSQKIKNIGPVNFDAIDELAELEAGAEFLRSQKEDLETAVSDMRQAIDKLNSESSTRFQETFVKVRENFQQMFTRLFGGGKADLILEEVTDPGADPLEAGIDVRAQPPGKEPKSISLLSGGEKALCAVALLFALFRSRPSPFCILDEVDGPLDESNIDRFMQQVKDFTDDTQFIIITHSQRTMGMTDEIWGVTQQVPGISTIHSLSFNAMEQFGDNPQHAADSREKDQESAASA